MEIYMVRLIFLYTSGNPADPASLLEIFYSRGERSVCVCLLHVPSYSCTSGAPRVISGSLF